MRDLLYLVRVGKLGVRTWLAAAMVICSTLNPALLVKYGPYVAVILWLTGNPARFKIGWTVWLTVAFGVWAAVSTEWAINALAYQDALVWVSLLVMFICLRDLIKTREQLRFLAWAYLAGLAVAVIVTLIQSWTTGSITGRYTLSDLNANYLGYSLAIGSAVIVLLWVTKENTFGAKLGLVAIGAAIIVGIELTGTRGAELGIACLLLWLLMCKLAKTPPIRALLTVITVIAVGIGTGFLNPVLSATDFGSRGDGTLSGRLGLWETARQLWATSPWIGRGLWAMRHTNPNGVDVHNVFLEIGSALGIIGVALFVALLWSALRNDTRGAENRLLLVGALLAASAPAYLSGAWEPTPASWILLALFSSIGSVLHVDPEPHDHARGRGRSEHHIERR